MFLRRLSISCPWCPPWALKAVYVSCYKVLCNLKTHLMSSLLPSSQTQSFPLMILASVGGVGFKTRPRSFLIKFTMYWVAGHWPVLGLVTPIPAMRSTVTRRYNFWLMRFNVAQLGLDRPASFVCQDFASQLLPCQNYLAIVFLWLLAVSAVTGYHYQTRITYTTLA